MIDAIATCTDRMVKVEGAARAGKTEALVRRAAALIKAGEAPESLLVTVSNAFAGQAFRQRLARALGDAATASKVNIMTALEACVATLDEPAAREATGRVPRILTDAEYNFFLEDMKTTGEKPRTLRNMLGYFYKQMASDAPKDDWNFGGAEDAVYDLAMRVLKLRSGMLAQEAPALCSVYLKSEAGQAGRAKYAYVLCDDFQNLSHAEQSCVCLLADKQVIVAGNPNETQKVRGSYPYSEGFVKFDAVRRDVKVFHLEGAHGNPEVIAFADALAGCDGMDDAYVAGSAQAIAVEAPEVDAAADEDAVEIPPMPTGIMAIKWNTPEDELNGITKYLRHMLPMNTNLRESRTAIVVPNRRWAIMAEKMLRRRGFNVSTAGAMGTLAGDPRNSSRAKALVAYTKLNLLANPNDMVAWRSWCGFDHALTNSDAWMGLQNFSEEESITLYEALEQVGNAGFGAKEPFLRARALAEKWRAGQEFISKNSSRRGFGLLKAIGGEGISEFEAVADTMVGDETAKQLFELERAAMTNPSWPEDPHVMHIVTTQNLVGTEYDNMFVLGCVDGYFPQRNAFEIISTEEERDRIMVSERRDFMGGVAKAKQTLVLSYFMKSDLELAERTKMQVVRVKSEGGKRMAIVRPTCFLAQAGDAAPTTGGGQALLAEHELN